MVFSGLFYKDISTSLSIMAANALLHSLTILITMVALLGVFHHKLNRSSRWRRSCAANSYGIYVVHLAIVTAIQHGLSYSSLPGAMKFLICGTVGLVASYLVSEYVLRRLPGLRSVL